MRQVAAFCTLFMIVGCDSQDATVAAQSSPAAAMRAYYDAAKRKDVAALKKLLSAATLKTLENPGVSIDRVLLSMTEDVPKTTPDIRNEKIDGNRATLEVWSASNNRWDAVTFVKEDGAWKVAPASETIGRSPR